MDEYRAIATSLPKLDPQQGGPCTGRMMAKRTEKEHEAEDKARTDEARKATKDYADEQRELQDKLRRKLN